MILALICCLLGHWNDAFEILEILAEVDGVGIVVEGYVWGRFAFLFCSCVSLSVAEKCKVSIFNLGGSHVHFLTELC